jgi:gliding motility-associated-like protein
LLSAPFQIGPNGNIYFLEQSVGLTGSSYGLSEITCAASPFPTVNRYIIDLTSFLTDGFGPQSLPQFVDAIFQRPVAEDTLVLDPAALFVCVDGTTTLQPREAGMEYLWSTGASSDTLLVSMPGTYCVTITGGCQPTIDCQEITADTPALTLDFLTNQDLGCEGIFARFLVQTSGRVDSIILEVIPDVGSLETSLVTGDTVDVPLIYPATSFTLTAFGPCGTNAVSQVFDLLPDPFAPAIVLLEDNQLCNGAPLNLGLSNSGTIPIGEVRWSDNSTDSLLSVDGEAGVSYFVDVTSICGETERLTFDQEIAEFCDCRAEVPQLITPNGDGTNDVFRLFSNCPPEDFTLLIFNRWGQSVFQSTDAGRGWDGLKDGVPQNTDTYLYRMVFRLPGVEKVQVEEGQFSLIR